MPQAFFDEQTDRSRIKTELVTKYFDAWARIMVRRSKTLAYVDLFSGPGYYSDGTPSTPIIVLQRAVADDELRHRLVTIFNDADDAACGKLSDAIALVPGIEGLEHKPQVICRSVGADVEQFFRQVRLPPTLLFVDPFGYKGVTASLISSVVGNWGCDAIFLFNYNRVRAAIHNNVVRAHIEALFGVERAAHLRAALGEPNTVDAEATVLGELAGALQDRGCRYVLPSCFMSGQGTRRSHYIVFVTKDRLGYGIMKDIMGKASEEEDGVATFRYLPPNPQYPLLTGLSRPFEELGAMLLQAFAGRRMSVQQVFDAHNVGTPYVLKNYQHALKSLEADAKISCAPGRDKRPKGTLAKAVIVTFPREAT